MRHLIFLVLFVGLSASAADGLYAIVKGTNVLAVWQFDATAPPKALTNAPYAGSTNVAVTEAEAAVINTGWTYANGEFRDPKGAVISNGTKARIDRTKLIDAAIAELNAMQVGGAKAVANWASLSAAQKDTAQKQTIQAVVRCSQIIELLLREQRALLELKEEAK